MRRDTAIVDVIARRPRRAAVVLGVVAALGLPTLASAAGNSAPSFLGAGGHYMAKSGITTGSPIGDVRAVDPDVGDTVTYSLTSGSGFAVDAQSGAITATRSLAIGDAEGAVRALAVSASDGTATVQSTFTVHLVDPSSATNGVRRERYEGEGGLTVSRVLASDKFRNRLPDTTVTLPTFDQSDDTRPYDFFATRFTAWLVPPVTGSYRFAVAANKAGELRLAPMATAGAVMGTAPIAASPTQAGRYQWLANQESVSAPVPLVAGQAYLLDAVSSKEYWGESFAVAWWGPRMQSPQPGSAENLIPTRRLYLPDVLPVSTPTVPQHFVVESIVSGAVTLSWSPSAGATATLRYEVRRDGTVIGSVSGGSGTPSFTDTGATGTHAYEVVAIDAAGGSSAPATRAGVDSTTPSNTLEEAIRTGNSALLSGPERATDEALAAANAAKLARYNLANAFWGGVSAPPGIEYSTPQFNSQFAINSTAKDRLFPILTASKRGYGGSITSCPAAGDCDRAMAIAGTAANGTRVSAFGVTPFPGGGVENGGNTNWSVNLRDGLDRHLAWLTTGDASATVSSTWRIALVKATGTAATIKGQLVAKGIGSESSITTCTIMTIATCLQGKDLVIAGADLSGSDAASIDAVDAAIGAAISASTPVLFAREPDSSDVLEAKVLPRMGASKSGWTQSWWGRADYTTAGSIAAYLESIRADTTYNGIIRLLNHLRTADWNVDMSGCAEASCGASPTAQAYLNTEFYPGAATFMRSSLMGLEGSGVEMFTTAPSQNRLLKLLVLLGDVYRRNVVFPISVTRGPTQRRWFESYFADHARYSLRGHSPAQRDLGTFSKQIRADVPRYAVTVTRATRTADYSTAAGVYALPGQAITIRRTDGGSATVSLSVNYLRDGSTQEFGSYARPKFLRHASVRLEPGRTYTYTSATGGPIYLALGNTASPQTITVDVTNVGKHPFWDGSASGDGSTARFAQLMEDGDYSWVDYVTPGYEVHSRYSYFRQTLEEPRWSNPEALADTTSKFFHQAIYNLVGNTGPGLSMSDSLRSLCEGRGWTAANGMACDQTAFRLDSNMHFNADQATCGFGCSGNPYDAWWWFSVVSWGGHHEMGHNVAQTFELNPHIPDSSTEVVPNVVAAYGYAFWNRHNPAKQEPIGKPLEQEAMYRSLNEAQRQSDPLSYSQNLIWRAAAPADPAAQVGNNGLFRLQIYMQLIQQSGARTDMTFGNGGWDVYTMARHWQRLLGQARTGDATFEARKARLGLGTYTRTEATSIPLNDLFLLATSWVTQRDQRPLLEMFGVNYSAKAAAQVAAWGVPQAPRVFYYWPTRVDGSAHWSQDAAGSMPVDGRVGGLPDKPVNFLFTAPEAGLGARTPLSTGVATSFQVGEPLTLYANVGAAGTVTFREGGAPIRGCVDLPAGPRTYTQWVSSQTELEAKCVWVPATAGPVSVTSVFVPTSGAKVGSVSPALDLTIVANGAAPTVTGVAPVLARVGERVTVSGTGLDQATQVAFNGLRAAFTRVSPTQMMVTMPEVPSSTTTGRLRIQTSAGLVAYSAEVTVRRLVTQVSINRRVSVLNPGQVLALQVVVTPEGATNQTTRWSSSTPAVATVDSQGRVTALAPGTTTIRVASDDGLVAATSEVSVTATRLVPVVALSTSTPAMELGLGGSRALAAPSFSPADATNTSVSWTTSDPMIATVNTAGVVTARAFGTATIRAVSDDSGVSVDHRVTVGLPVTADDSANTISGLTGAMEYSVQNGRTGTWVAYTNDGALPDLTGNLVVRVRRAGTTAPVTALVFADALGRNSALLGYDPAVTYLSDIPCVSPCATGWASLGYDRANDGGSALKLRRGSTAIFDTYAKGMGVHATSTLTYNLGGGYARFRANVGPDKRGVDSGYGTVVFTVKGDGGAVLYTSAPTTAASAPQVVDIDVTGVNTLTLVVSDGGNGNTNDLGNWGGAHLLRPITGLSLNTAGTSLAVGAETALVPTVTALSGASTSVTWASSDPSVAMVSASGRVTGVAPGTATITATSVATPAVSATARVRVTAPTVWSITLDRSSAMLAQGASTTLVPTVRADSGAAAPVWSSSDSSVATVNAQGTVTGVVPGTAVISLGTADGAVVGRARVTVGAGVTPVSGVTLDRASLSLAVGANGTLTATVAPAGASDARVAWTSSNARVATVGPSGTITGVSPGTAQIAVRTLSGGRVAMATVTVTQVAIPVTGVTLSAAQVSLAVGQESTLVPTVAPAGATVTATRWSSSNGQVAVVSTTGRVTAVGRGTATIRATTVSGGYVATATVTVAQAAQTSAPNAASARPGGAVTTAVTPPLDAATAARRAKVTVPPGATAKVTVLPSQSATCRVRSGAVVAVGNGPCTVTVRVTTRFGTTVARRIVVPVRVK